MWTGDRPTFTDRHYHIDGPINEPKNATGTPAGKIPLWIGGGGEKVTLKLVAQYGDACNVGGGRSEVIRHKLDVLTQHCETVGRDMGEIAKPTSCDTIYPIAAGTDPRQATARLRERLGNVPYDTFAQGKTIAPADEIGERIQAAVDVGIDYAVIYMPGLAYGHKPLHRFAEEIIPRFSGNH